MKNLEELLWKKSDSLKVKEEVADGTMYMKSGCIYMCCGGGGGGWSPPSFNGFTGCR